MKLRLRRNHNIRELGKEYQIKMKKWQWRILFSFGILYFFYYFGRENIGFIIPLLKEEYDWSSAKLGIVTAPIKQCEEF